MKIVIAGCRDYNNYDEAEIFIEEVLHSFIDINEITIVSGNCTGADKIGEIFALKHNLKLEIHPAEWKKYGKYAGPKRNQIMAEIADIVICFWDKKSRGTASMIKCAKKLNKPVYIKEISNNV